jgi:hypothetical protein
LHSCSRPTRSTWYSAEWVRCFDDSKNPAARTASFNTYCRWPLRPSPAVHTPRSRSSQTLADSTTSQAGLQHDDLTVSALGRASPAPPMPKRCVRIPNSHEVMPRNLASTRDRDRRHKEFGRAGVLGDRQTGLSVGAPSGHPHALAWHWFDLHAAKGLETLSGASACPAGGPPAGKPNAVRKRPRRSLEQRGHKSGKFAMWTLSENGAVGAGQQAGCGPDL